MFGVGLCPCSLHSMVLCFGCVDLTIVFGFILVGLRALSLDCFTWVLSFSLFTAVCCCGCTWDLRLICMLVALWVVFSGYFC